MAERHVREALVVEGVPPHKRREYFDTLAQILLAKGDAAGALEAFEAGLAEDANAAHLHLGRARSLVSLGRSS